MFWVVCLSLCLPKREGSPCDYYPWCIRPDHIRTPWSHSPVQGPPDMFKPVQLGPHCTPPPDIFKLIHYEVRTVGKWAVGILLECLLESGILVNDYHSPGCFSWFLLKVPCLPQLCCHSRWHRGSRRWRFIFFFRLRGVFCILNFDFIFISFIRNSHYI